MHPLQLISGILGFILLTSKEIVWVRPWTGAPIYNAIVSCLFAFHFLSLFTRLEASHLKIRLTLKWEKLPGINFLVRLVGFLAAYFLFHEWLIGDVGRSYKYAVYSLFLISLLSQSYNFTAVCKVFATLSIATSFVLVLQLILIAVILDNDLRGTEMLASFRPDGVLEFRHYNPFWLGLVAQDSLVDYGFIDFYRANAWTTEPKYCSQALIGGLVSLLYISKPGTAFKRIGIIAISLGLLVSHAYSMIAVLAFAYALIHLGKSRKATLYAMVAIAVLFTAVTVLSTYASSFSGYASMRIGSFLQQVSMADETAIHLGGLFGTGAETEAAKRTGLPPFMRLTIQMGVMGTVLNAILMFVALSQTLKGIYYAQNKAHKTLLALSCSLIIVFNTFFTSEPISPLYSFLYALIFRTSGKWCVATEKKEFKPLVQFAPGLS